MPLTDQDFILTTEAFDRVIKYATSWRKLKPAWRNAKPLFEESGIELCAGMRCVVLADTEGWFAVIALEDDDDAPYSLSDRDLLHWPQDVARINRTYGDPL